MEYWSIVTTASALYVMKMKGNPLSGVWGVIGAVADTTQSRTNKKNVENSVGEDVAALLTEAGRYFRILPGSLDAVVLKNNRIRLCDGKGKKLVQLHLKRKQFEGLLDATNNLKGQATGSLLTDAL